MIDATAVLAGLAALQSRCEERRRFDSPQGELRVCAHRKLGHRGDPQVPQTEPEGQVFLNERFRL
jgi:hypothetical protein